jgi:hypothetical protein
MKKKMFGICITSLWADVVLVNRLALSKRKLFSFGWP